VISPQSVWKGFLIAYSLHCLLILTKKCPKASKRHITLTLDWGGGVCTQWGAWWCALTSTFGGLAPLVFGCLGLPRQSCGWTVFGTTKVWRGVLWSPHTEPRFSASWNIQFSTLLSCRSAPPCRCELQQAGKSDARFCLVSPLPLHVLIKFLQLNTESWLSFNLRHEIIELLGLVESHTCAA